MHFEDFDASPPAARQDAELPTRLQYLIDNTPALIYCTVPSGDFKMTFVSNNAFNMLGYRPEEMMADPNFWFDHIHPDDAPRIVASLAEVFTEGQRVYEYRFRAADGRYLWMHDTLRLIRDAAGRPLEVIGALTDITDRKAMEEALLAKGIEQQQLIGKLREAHEQLLQAEKMASVGQLAAGIAHEINNPIGFVNSNMSSLQGYVGALLQLIDAYDDAIAGQPALVAQMVPVRQAADLDFLRGDVTALVSESIDGLRRVKEIVQSLREFSHVGETEWQLADLHRGLDSTLTIAANELKYKVTVVKEYGNLPLVECRASQLNQVFMNLLVNAVQAITGRGVIRIRTGVQEDWVWIEIADTGAGIAPEHLTRIFEPFFTTKPVGSGTGLGLSLSYGIVNRHGGRIDVHSQPGEGTTFTVWLPQHPPQRDAGNAGA
ncbi:ATP-binding protein [Pseudoduganella umbonata]|uniref:histidine kinase n=1 Tax=Pseudoduganella umbonata TaxID=864828 RepID=A0A4P8HZZ2_9BURK|nr:ATP-binding protein [Pseudoduganella umbonata]MBB3224044.1 PAS domain S-box-containing protein [Pseudoduganella umbonata]QCP14084.1 PAS domain S-box protein [Pseudoduganella umbonata]